MKRFKLLTICILAFLFSQPVYSQSIKGYFPYYRSVAQANAVQYNKLTDVIYAFASLNSDGTLAIMSPTVFDAVQAKCVANGVKLHIAIGGWGLSGNFSGVAANATYRNNLANACLSLCQTKGLAGIDIDWEFPASYDKTNFTLMLQAIKSKLGSNYTLSAALGGEAAHTVGIEAAAFTHLDYFNIMTYDAPMPANSNHTSVQFMKDAMEIYRNLGCPYSKMIPGAAFYARDGWSEPRTYADISSSNPSSYYNDADGIINVWSFDSKVTLDAKIDYAVGQRGASGFIIWEISQDRSDQYSLLSAMKTKMDTYACSLTGPDMQDASLCGAGTVTLKAYSGTAPSGVTYSWKKDGATISGSSNSLSVSSAGTYEVIVSKSGCSKNKSAVVSASLPTVSLGSTKDLCNPATVTLNAGINGSGINYAWTKNNAAISGANSQTYTVSSAGTYGVTVSATGCASKTSSVVITSSLVDVNGVSRCGAGSVTMAINSPVNGATYEWYTAASNGTKVNTGTSYSPNITGTTTYYIEKVTVGSNCQGVSAYVSGNIYTKGMSCIYNNTLYTAEWWTQSIPGSDNSWTTGGSCAGASCARTPVTATMTTGCSSAPTISFANISKTYGDGSFTAAVASNSTGTVTYTATGTGATITSAGVVTITGAGTVTITANQAAAGSYTSGSATATLTIAKKLLTVTAANKTKAYNAANPALTVTYSGFVGSDNAASLATQPTVSTTATTTSAVGTYDINASGAASNNYNFAYVKGTLTVTAITPTITFTNISKTYGDASFQAGATSNSAGAITYTVTGTGATITPAGVVTITGAGSVTITATQAANGNYSGATKTATLTITKKLLTVTAANKTKAYNAANPALTVTYSGFAGSDNAASLATQPTVNTTATTTSAVGTYDINASGAASNNYNFTYVKGTLTVTAVTPTITFANISKTYGDASFSAGATSNSAGSITYSATGTGATITSAGVVTITGAGSVTITATQPANGNYSSTSKTATLTIAKKALTVTADNKSKAYNTANPALTIVYSGFTGSDNAASLTTQPTASTTAVTSSPSGTYDITVTGGVSNNYTFTYVKGTLTINAAGTPTINLSNINKTYGDASFTVNASSNSSGTITYSAIGTAATITPTGVVTIKGAGSVTITVSQAAGGSYSTGTVTATLTIAKKVLTVTAENKSRAYNTANPAFSVIYSGFAGSDNTASLTTQATASTQATISSPAGNYTITPLGAASNNYSFTYKAGTLTILEAPLPNLQFTNPNSGEVNSVISLNTNSPSSGSVIYTVTNGTGTASISGNQLTALTPGTVTVTAIITGDGNYAGGTVSQIITITGQTTGIDDLTYVSDLKLYPVPATDQLTLGLTLAKESSIRVELADTEGKTVSLSEQDLMIGTHDIIIPVYHLANGIYIAKIYLDGQMTIKKITVLK